MKKTIAKSTIVMGALALLVSGCCVRLPYEPRPGEMPPCNPIPYPRPQAKAGAIYKENYSINLFADRVAQHIGDILTVNLIEHTDASKSAKTTAKKNTSSAIDDSMLFGTTANLHLPKILPLKSNNNNLAFELGSKQDFKGEGDSDQSNKLLGEITVTVCDVLPNGNLVICGEKWITINQGDEYIRLTGIVRPDDINPDNSVNSPRIANARIAYGGRGHINDVNSAGWLARFFAGAFRIMPF